MLNMMLDLQKRGYHVVKTAPYVYDVSERRGDTLYLVGIMALEDQD